MGKLYYHNVSKKQFNETEPMDLIDDYDDGDLLLVSEEGNACLRELTPEEHLQLQRDYLKPPEDE